MVQSLSHMLELPKRITLAEQTAHSIRKAIEDGAWPDALPGERRLSEIFKVSRPTVRAAVQLLANDGWLDLRRDRRNRRITRRPRSGARPASLVCVVTQVPVARWSEAVHHAYSEIRARLAGDGFAVEVLVCGEGGIAAHQRKVSAYLKQNRVNCCVLLSVKYDLQRWLAGLGVPALVIGSRDPNVKLPSFEVDYRATCRHAAATFLRLGHRRLALIVPNTRRGGDLASEEGFLEGVRRFPARPAASATVARHQDTGASILQQLDQLFSAKEPPTALLVTASRHAFTLLYGLLARGLRIPQDVSIISSDPDPYFHLVSPPFTHYAFPGGVYVNRLTRLCLKLVREGRLPPKAHLIEQKYVAGATVARAPDAAPPGA